MDINIVIKKGLIYSVAIAVVSLIYLLIVFALERVAQGLFGYTSVTLSIATAFGLGIVFIPLRHKIQEFVDKYFFKGTHEEISEQNELLRAEVARAERHKAVATLASGMAHEIKNPLTAITTFSEYLPQKLGDKEFLKKFARIVGGETARINNIVNQLMDFSKPAPLNRQPTDINRLIEDTLHFLNSQFLRRRIQTIQHLEPNTCHLNVDKNQIRQVLLNLFLNAIDAMPDGGVLTVSTSLHPSRFTIHVKDTGKGIPKEDIKHIFDPFFSKKDQSTGLGLSITKGIVEEHQGKIEVESTAGGRDGISAYFPGGN